MTRVLPRTSEYGRSGFDDCLVTFLSLSVIVCSWRLATPNFRVPPVALTSKRPIGEMARELHAGAVALFQLSNLPRSPAAGKRHELIGFDKFPPDASDGCAFLALFFIDVTPIGERRPRELSPSESDTLIRATPPSWFTSPSRYPLR